MKYPDRDTNSRSKDSQEGVIVNGLKIIPKAIKFTRTLSGESLYKKIHFMNVSTKTIRFVISRPYSSAFIIKDDGIIINLGPGMSTVKKLLFSNTENNVIDSSLPIKVENVSHILPIGVERIKSHLSVTPTHLDFGVLNVGGQFAIRTIQIKNNGDCTGKFVVDVGSTDFTIMAEPRSGRLKPECEINVNITIAGKVVGDFSHEFWVTSESPSRVFINVSAVIPCLKIYHVGSSQDFAVIDFGIAYYKTCCTETFIVHNYSSEATTFVVLAEYNTQFQSLSLIQSRTKEFDWLCIRPLEGRLAPFEAREFTARFCPAQTDNDKNDDKNVFWTLLKIVRVDVKDTQLDVTSINQLDNEMVKMAFDNMNLKDNYITSEISICLYGKAEEADLNIEPDKIHCSLSLGESCVRTVSLTNKSTLLEIEYECIKRSQVEVKPYKSVLPPGGKIEVTVILKAKSCTFHKALVFHLNSYCNLSQRKNNIILKKKILRLDVQISLIKKKKIKPGALKSSIVSEPGPPGAVVPFKPGIYPPRNTLMRNSFKYLNKQWLKDATIDFPADRISRFLIKKSSETKQASSIGGFRFLSLMTGISTPGEITKRKKVNSLLPLKPNTSNISDVYLDEFNDYDVSNPRHRLLIGMHPCLTTDEGVKSQKVDQCSVTLLVPLTPTQLFNITILPPELVFGKIPVYQECSLHVKIENLNYFPIRVKFLPNTDLKIPQKNVLVDAFSKQSCEVHLTRKYIGFFYSNLSYIINGNHTFHKKVTAEGVHGGLEVTPKVLHLKPQSLYEITDETHCKLTIYNPFMAPVPFNWKLFSYTNVEIVPTHGIVMPKSYIICLVYLRTRMTQTYCSEILLLMDEGKYEERIKCIVEPKAINHEVILISRLLQLGTLAIGIPYERKVFIFNNGYTSTRFSVVSVSPVDGVEVYPKFGVIPPKALEPLTVRFFFDCLMLLDFYLCVNVQNLYTLKLHVTGKTVFPLVEFIPDKINIHKTCCYSYSTTPIMAYNHSKAEVKLQFLMNEFIQFKLSTSENYLDPGIPSEGIQLLAEGCCELFLHFTPLEINSYEFILPAVINNLIGPPIISQPDSIKPNEYLRSSINKAKFSNCPQKLPSTFSHVRIDCCVKQAEIVLPQLRYNFFSAEYNHRYDQLFKVQNPTFSNLKIQFDTSDVWHSPFRINPIDSPPKAMYNIPPKGVTEFKISFEPTASGSWESIIPIFMLSPIHDISLYNNIQINGICYHSSLSCENSEIHFLPVPTNTLIEKNIQLLGSYQQVDSTVTVSFSENNYEYISSSKYLNVIFPNGKKIARNKSLIVLPVTVAFRSSEAVSIKIVVTFNDGLDGECQLSVYATAANSLVSTHIHHSLTNDSFVENNEDSPSVSLLTKLYNEGAMYKSTSTESIGSYERRFSAPENAFEYKPKSDSRSQSSDLSQETAMTFEEWDMFPEFPPANIRTSYTSYMNRTTKYVSKWLLLQALNGIYQPKIGVDIALSKPYRDFIKGHPVNTPVKTTIDLIISLFGSEVLTAYGIPSNIPQTGGMDRIFFCLHLFKKIIHLLEKKGNALAHITPLYLLSYEDYVTLCQYERKNSPEYLMYTKSDGFLKNHVTYERISKQLWMDLYLQIFKTHTIDFEVCRIYHKLTQTGSLSDLEPKKHSLHSIKLRSIKLLEEMPRTSLSDIKSNYCMGEKVLLAWLTDSYKKAATYNFAIPQLNGPISDFRESLRDSLVLAAVTAYYCPFLIRPYLRRLYFNPISAEELKHNANNLLIAWDSLRLKFCCKTLDIVNADSIFMVMLVSYLYLSLPEYLPAFILEFKIPLGSTSTQVVHLQNTSDEVITYEVKIFQDSTLFSIQDAKDIYELLPGEKCSLKIRYNANRTTRSRGDLLFCAARTSGIQGRNSCIKLLGEPNQMTISSKFTIHLPVHRLTFVTLKIMNPYEKSCTFTINISTVEPNPDGEFETHWLNKDSCKIPLEVYISVNEVNPIKSKKFFTLPTAICCHSTFKKNYWILFSNSMVGEFLVQVILIPHLTFPRALFKVNYPVVKCNDPEGSMPITPVNLKLPSMYSPMWNAAADMINLSLSPKDLFWAKYIASPIGMKLFEFEVSHYCPASSPTLAHFFRKKVTYSLDWDSDYILGPKKLVIEDVHSNDVVNLKMLVDKSANEPFSMTLTLTSDDGKEIRIYQVNFIPSYINRRERSSK